MTKKFPFRIFGKNIQADINLLPFQETNLRKGVDIQIRRNSRKSLRGAKVSWFHEISGGMNQCQGRFGKVESDFIFELPGMVIFRIRKNGKIIHYSAAKGLSDNSVAALILTQALPFTLPLLGVPTLHAATIEKNGKAFAFLGQQGQGKSTLAAMSVAMGLNILGDDALPLELRGPKVICFPSFPEVRLYPKTMSKVLGQIAKRESLAANSKLRLFLGDNYAAKPLPLAGVFCLGHAKKIRIVRLRPGQALQKLLASSFRISLQNRKNLAEELEFLVSLIERVPIYSLEYPKGLLKLPSVIEAALTWGENNYELHT